MSTYSGGTELGSDTDVGLITSSVGSGGSVTSGPLGTGTVTLDFASWLYPYTLNNSGSPQPVPSLTLRNNVVLAGDFLYVGSSYTNLILSGSVTAGNQLAAISFGDSNEMVTPVRDA